MAVEFRRCEEMKADGTQCRGRALPDRSMCAFHDPTTQEAQAAGRRAGGRKRCQPAAVLGPGPDVPLTTVPDVTSFLGTIANRTARGELDAKASNATVYALATLLRAIQPDEVARQVEELRREVAELKESRNDDDDATKKAGGTSTRNRPAQIDGGNAAGADPVATRPGVDHGDGDDAAGSVAAEIVDDGLYSAAPPLL